MAKSIEILEDTILKLIVRQGTDADRQSQILDSGELGYTTDTKRLYVGDTSQGGVLVGNKFLGASTDVTTLAPASYGDLAFDENVGSLMVNVTGSGSSSSDWTKVSGVYTANDGTIVINPDNSVSVGTLVKDNLDSDLLGDDLSLDSNNRITLDDDISVSSISHPLGNAVSLVGDIGLEGNTYTFPSTVVNSGVLTTDALGHLRWDTIKAEANYFVSNPDGLMPIGTILAAVSNSLDSTWLPCDGTTRDPAAHPELFAEIGTTYGGDGTTTFNLPLITDKVLYGDTAIQSANPVDIEDNNSGTIGGFSVIFYIKATPDNVFNSTWTFNHPLSATVDGVDTTGTPVNPLSGDLVVTMPDSLTPKAYVSFLQDGTIEKSLNTASVTLTSSVIASNEVFRPSGKNFEYYGDLVGSDTTYYDLSGYTGVYLIDLEDPISDPNSIVEVSYDNYYSEEVATGSLRDVHLLYRFFDPSTLIVVVATSMNIDNSSSYRLFLDSGLTNLGTPSATRFNVCIK